MQKLGLLTIGQSPRIDITPNIQKVIGEHVTIVEKGVLDGLSHKEIAFLQPEDSEVNIYVSRLRDGDSVKLSKRKLTPYIERKIKSFEESEIERVLILCTGDFQKLKSEASMLYPDKIVKDFVQSILKKNSVLGIIAPDKNQKNMILDKWAGIGAEIIFKDASPYKETDLKSVTKYMSQAGVDFIILDCMGYNDEHQEIVQELSNVTTILPKAVTANFLKTLYE